MTTTDTWYDTGYADGLASWTDRIHEPASQHPAYIEGWNDARRRQRDDRARAEKAHREIERLRTEVRDAAVQGVRDGMSEVQAADIYGVNRLTIRKWLGKDRA